MSKTPEEMAEEYSVMTTSHIFYRELLSNAFLAGYKAAMEQVEGYKTKAHKWGQELCELNLKYADKCAAYAEKCAEDEGQDAMGPTNLLTPAKWISVKDRLPELGEEVLVLGNEGSLEVRRLTLRKIHPDEKDPHYWLDGWDESADYTVTHWMPLPEPPKEEK